MFQEKTSGFEEVRSGSSYLFEVGLGCFFWYCWWFWNPAFNSPVEGTVLEIYHYYTVFLFTIPSGWEWDFWTINSTIGNIWNWNKNTGFFLMKVCENLGWVMVGFLCCLSFHTFSPAYVVFQNTRIQLGECLRESGGNQAWFPSSGVSPVWYTTRNTPLGLEKFPPWKSSSLLSILNLESVALSKNLIALSKNLIKDNVQIHLHHIFKDLWC